MPKQADPLTVAIAPAAPDDFLPEAVAAGGGRVVSPEAAQALIWTGKGPTGLAEILAGHESITWVQLPSAGIEAYASLLDDRRDWTCAKGIYGRQVAEHALAMTLAGVHALPRLARAGSWRKTVCRDLYGGTVTIVGAGGITAALLPMLAPLQVEITVVRRHPEPVEGVARVLPSERLEEALPGADVVILALPLTPQTRGIIGATQLRAMKADAWLVNVGRGKLVRTDDLVRALREHWIGGAALDVTDPEPLPDDHPLWTFANCLISPHCANPPGLEQADYAALVRDNVQRRRQGEPLLGLIDVGAGY